MWAVLEDIKFAIGFNRIEFQSDNNNIVARLNGLVDKGSNKYADEKHNHA